MSTVPIEFCISSSSNISHGPMNADCVILTSIFEDSNKIYSRQTLIGSLLLESGDAITKLDGDKPKKKTKLQMMKDLGLLGAVKDDNVTSINFKKHLEDYFGNSCE